MDDVVNNIDGIVEFNEVKPLQVKAPVTFNEEFIVTELLKLEFPDTFNISLIVVLFENIVIPDTFNELSIVVLFDNVVILLTLNELWHIIGCDIFFNTTYDEEVEVIPFGVGINPKSPHVGVKKPTVFILNYLMNLMLKPHYDLILIY